MSPTQFQFHEHAKRESSNTLLNPSSSSSLKINKDSHSIKKSSPSSSSSSSSTLVNGVANVTAAAAAAVAKPQQQRHPVIIYTHSPKIIHTHPKDFMALVQKLTGLSRSDHDDQNASPPPPPPLVPPPKSEPNNFEFNDDDNKNTNKIAIGDDNESSSVVTDENNGSLGDNQVNSCYVPNPIFDPANTCFNSNIPFFNPNSAEFLCSAQPFYNYSDSFFFLPNMRSSFSSSTLESMKELPEF